MKALKLTIEFEDGSIRYIDDVHTIRTIGLTIPKDILWKTGSAVEALRNKYFQMLTELNKAKTTGYTKADLHEALKPLLMAKFKDFPQYFTNNTPEYTTRTLNREGWIALIEQLKSISADVYGYVFN